jgi:hypothetical protein
MAGQYLMPHNYHLVLPFWCQKTLELHYAEGPRNVITDTFSRFTHSYVSSLLVWKKAANVVSDSESNHRNESSHSLLMDDRDIIDCLLNLPCLSSRKKKEKETNKMQKVFRNDIVWEQILIIISFSWFHCQTVLSQSPWRFGWRQPLRYREYQRHKTMMRNSCSLLLCTQIGTVTRLLMMLKTSCVILSLVIFQPTGKLHYLRTW